MKSEPVIDARCVSTMRNLEGFLDGRLPERSANLVSSHLNECPSCRREVEVRKNMNSRLKAAVKSAQPSPYLATRIMAQVRAQERRPQWLHRKAWAGAAAALVLATAVSFKLYDVRQAVESQDAYISRLVRNVSAIMSTGLMNHVHCSVFRKYPDQAPAIETLHREIGPEYKELLDAVSASVPAEFKVHIAHECGYGDRDVVHIGLHDGSRQLSVILTRRKPGESFRNSELLPVISQGGFDVFAASAERFQIAGLQTETHLAYVVSDISRQETQRLLLALAPTIQRTLSNIQG